MFPTLNDINSADLMLREIIISDDHSLKEKMLAIAGRIHTLGVMANFLRESTSADDSRDHEAYLEMLERRFL